LVEIGRSDYIAAQVNQTVADEFIAISNYGKAMFIKAPYFVVFGAEQEFAILIYQPPFSCTDYPGNAFIKIKSPIKFGFNDYFIFFC